AHATYTARGTTEGVAMAVIDKERNGPVFAHRASRSGGPGVSSTRRWASATIMASGLAFQFAMAGCGEGSSSLGAETAENRVPMEVASGDTAWESGSTPKVSSEADSVNSSPGEKP